MRRNTDVEPLAKLVSPTVTLDTEPSECPDATVSKWGPRPLPDGPCAVCLKHVPL